MTKRGIEPEDAEDGYYWSTACQDVVHIDRSDVFWEDVRCVHVFGNEIPDRIDEMEGHLVPLDLPPAEAISDER